MVNKSNEDIITKDFELGAILTMTTGYSCIDDFSKVFELVWFVCDDNMINTIGLGVVKDDVKNHLLTIHPELKNVRYKKGEDIQEFLFEQEEKFGNILPVTKLGMKLPEKKDALDMAIDGLLSYEREIDLNNFSLDIGKEGKSLVETTDRIKCNVLKKRITKK